jgi:simple sugar transport system permease protein
MTTSLGLRMRAAGDRGEAAAAAGLDRAGLRLGAHLIAGAAAGLAGALLASRIAAYVPGMASGRGWIALVALFLGGRRAGGVLLASLGFGLLIALSNAAQAFALWPAELILALPYLATALALVVGRAAERARAR